MQPVVALFDYDRSVPIRLQVVSTEHRDGVAVNEVRYDNGTGGTADAFLTEPADRTTRGRPGVVFAHGGSGPGKHIFLGEAIELSRRGMFVLGADTSMPPLGDAAADEAGFVAAILVQRRGLDALDSARDVTRLGFYGHSFGGNQGATLSAVEPRLDAIVIAAMGAGVADWVRRQGFSDEEYLAASDRFDPVHFVGASRSRLLFQHGRQDTSISLESARALYDAALEPKTWRDYDCGHGVDGHAPARADRFAFLADALAAA
jgi:dipeptidyl aminopeptidase/acylaminoacyl peptidase